MTSAPCLIVLQARMGSTRLPGKVLENVGGCSVLERCVRRLAAADCGPVVVATTYLAADNPVAAAAQRLGARCVRGAVDDVLARFALAAHGWSGPYVIRATADNPLVDVAACSRALEQLRQGADYVVEASLPIGAAIEAMTTNALHQAQHDARDAYDREHVTPWMRRAEAGLLVCRAPSPQSLMRSDLRFTVDTPADLAYVRRIVAQAGPHPLLPLEAYIKAADVLARHPYEGPCDEDLAMTEAS